MDSGDAEGLLHCVPFAVGQPEQLVFMYDETLRIDEQIYPITETWGPLDYVVLLGPDHPRFFVLTGELELRIIDVDITQNQVIADQSWWQDNGEIAPSALAQADVDIATPGPELVVVSATLEAGQLDIHRGAETGAPEDFGMQTTPLPLRSRTVLTGQLDDDPQAELLIVPFPMLELLRADVDDDAIELTLIDLDDTSFVDVAVADVDGDGIAEILALNATKERIEIIR
ncbi:MAG: hypothetical protein HC927_00080 [Deltaproteobacteria bacterium]|nr:hypothetical protein [Deltaproteobacteria bacterium]